MVDIVAQASVEADAMDVEVRERLDSLHEKLHQAKTLHSINPQQAEIIYKSLIAEGSFKIAIPGSISSDWIPLGDAQVVVRVLQFPDGSVMQTLP